jgi:hypothetical protein
MDKSPRVCSCRRLAMVVAALMLAACVNMEFSGGDSAEARQSGAGLSSEQRWHLRNAAKEGEHELVATVGRMAWDNPQQANALGNYAIALLPESESQINATVKRTVQ